MQISGPAASPKKKKFGADAPEKRERERRADPSGRPERKREKERERERERVCRVSSLVEFRLCQGGQRGEPAR